MTEAAQRLAASRRWESRAVTERNWAEATPLEHTLEAGKLVAEFERRHNEPPHLYDEAPDFLGLARLHLDMAREKREAADGKAPTT